MARPRLRKEEHKFLARIDQELWDKIIERQKQRSEESDDVSLNDVVNEVIEAGTKRMKL